MVIARKNAIEERLDTLGERWDEFVEQPGARALIFQVTRDEVALADGFIRHRAEGGGDTRDLFIRFDEPFEKLEVHGLALTRAFRGKYEEVREGLKAEGIDAGWQPPIARAGDTDLGLFVKCCGSFIAHHDDLFDHLAVALVPQAIADRAAWARWLLALVRAPLPAKLRLLLLDDVDAPALDAVARAEPARVRVVDPDLDLPGALNQLIQQAPGSGPGLIFRKHFVALATAAGKGDVAAAQASGKVALEIAARERWAPLQVAVHMALGAAQLAARQIDGALASYRGAAAIAGAAAKNGDAAAPKLQVQARLAEGGALVMAGRPAEAAPVYEEAARLAEAQQDHLMTLEGYRMGAYCHEISKKPDASWRDGQLALRAAERMDADARARSTLPYVGQGLLRLIPRHERERAQQVRARMDALAGVGWEKKLG